LPLQSRRSPSGILHCRDITKREEQMMKRPKETSQRTPTVGLQPLSPAHAFVVQFRGEIHSGRVEHLTSGQTTRFPWTGEMLEFMESVQATQASAKPSRAGPRKEGR